MSGPHLPFFEEGMARWPFGPPHAGVALDLVGTPPAPDELRALVNERWGALPRLGRVLVAPTGARTGPAWWAGRHRWAVCEDHEPARHVRSEDGTLEDGVRDWFDDPFPAGRPPWNLHLLRGTSDGGFSLLLRMHHSLLDGRSVTTLLRALLDGCRPPDAAASLAAPGDRRRTARAAEWAGGPPGMLTSGRPVPMPDQGVREPAFTVVRLPSDALRAAREAVPDRRATTNEVFLAVVSGVLRSRLTLPGPRRADDDRPGSPKVWLSVPVDERPADRGAYLGNAFANIRVPAPVALPDASARLAAVTGLLTTATRGRDRVGKLVEGAFTALPGATQTLLRRKFFLPAYAPAACSYVHLRDRGETLAGRPVRSVTAIPMVPPAGTVTFALGGCTGGHTLSVATNAGSGDAGILAGAFVGELERLADRTRHAAGTV
ncbi:wax ester/triacylglycerol synthase domain-containing protein [Kitasatospora sp. NBC_01539]|uniref:wax ester/triacylglycerol synthase domain-containing protein n=1 Tax=Kitasatospora sp. NBC_01539 TaxID=2903577 RepID=UPI0038601A41